MRLNSLILVLILSISFIPLPPAQAQIGAPDVNLQCSPSNIPIDVYPGADLTGYTICTVSNPNSYQEKISIEVTADGLATSAPSSITLGPNAEEDFQVTVRGEQNMRMQSRSMVVKATVTEVMGAPPPNIAEKEQQLIIDIRQFAGVQVDATEAITTVDGGSEIIAEFYVYNLGNAYDFFLYRIDSQSLEIMENEGFSISLPQVKTQVEWGNVPVKVRVILKAPTDNEEWEINSDGMREASFTLNFEAVSEFSCNQGNCISDTASMTITVLQEVSTTEELISSVTDNQMLIYGGSGAGLLLVILLVLAVKKRKNRD